MARDVEAALGAERRKLSEEVPGVEVGSDVEVVAADDRRPRAALLQQQRQQRHEVVALRRPESVAELARPGEPVTDVALVVAEEAAERAAELRPQPARVLLVDELHERPHCVGVHQVDEAAVEADGVAQRE